MTELAQHIEVSLLENDCVIVPGLGGFVAHHVLAMRVAEEDMLPSPTRTIGFSPQLKMSDGLLVQSYMAVYGTDFSNATRIVGKIVKESLSPLHEDREVDLPNMGGPRYSIHGTYDFVPHNNKITTPHLYGLDYFEMQELTVLRKPYDNKAVPLTPAVRKEKKRVYRIGINPPYSTNVIVIIAITALFFFFSTPIENTRVVEANYAWSLPSGLFGQTGKQPLATTPIVVRQQPGAKKARISQANLPQTANKKIIVPVTVGEVKVRQQPVTVSASCPEAETVPTVSAPQPADMPYRIIAASVGIKKNINTIVQQLVTKGYAGARAIIGDNKMHASVQSCVTEKEAYCTLNQIRLDETYRSAWVLKKWLFPQ